MLLAHIDCHFIIIDTMVKLIRSVKAVISEPIRMGNEYDSMVHLLVVSPLIYMQMDFTLIEGNE